MGRAALRDQVLLLVVALVLLALAVTVPWYAVPRQKARAASCLSNLRSLSLSTLTYANDWNGRFPPRPASLMRHSLDEGKGAAPDLARHLPPDDWRRRIRYRNDNVFFCPSTRSLYSYEFNSNMYGIRLESLDRPTYTPLEYDAGFTTSSPPGPHRQAGSDGYNTAYCDGHVFWMPGAYRHGAWESLTLTGR